jgi:hypothetical protein
MRDREKNSGGDTKQRCKRGGEEYDVKSRKGTERYI